MYACKKISVLNSPPQLEYPPYEVSGMQIRIENISDGSEEQLNFHLDFSFWNENASFKTGKCNRENCSKT